MPLDEATTPEGNLILSAGVAHHISTIPEAEWPATRYVSHFATCPQGARWRKP